MKRKFWALLLSAVLTMGAISPISAEEVIIDLSEKDSNRFDSDSELISVFEEDENETKEEEDANEFELESPDEEEDIKDPEFEDEEEDVKDPEFEDKEGVFKSEDVWELDEETFYDGTDVDGMEAELLEAAWTNGGTHTIAGNGTGGITINIDGSAYTTKANEALNYPAPFSPDFPYGIQGCTWYATARLYELTKISAKINTGATWFDSLYSTYGFTAVKEVATISTPAFACYGNHIAVIEKNLGNGNYVISEGGYNSPNEGVGAANGYCRIAILSKYEIEHKKNKTFKGYVFWNTGGSNVEANLSFSNVGTTFVDHWNAGIYGTIVNPNGATITNYAAIIEDGDTGARVDIKWGASQYCSGNYLYYNIVENIISGGLQSGHRYRFRFVAIANGKEYYSDPYYFTTTDNQAPVISNVQVYDINQAGYSIRCTVTDNVGVTKVQFPTWTGESNDSNYQDDLVWYDATLDGNTAYARIESSKHNDEEGRYITHVYAWDAAGNSSSIQDNSIGVDDLLPDDWIEVEGVIGGKIGFDTSTGKITGCSRNVTKANLPDRINGVEVKTISDHAFKGCKKLKEITIPKSVTSIGQGAFNSCIELTAVTLPNGVTKIADWTFFNCRNLLYVEVSNDLTDIGKYAFGACDQLYCFYFPENIKTIGQSAFFYCSGLHIFEFAGCPTSIGTNAFSSCTGVSEIWLQNSFVYDEGNKTLGCGTELYKLVETLNQNASKREIIFAGTEQQFYANKLNLLFNTSNGWEIIFRVKATPTPMPTATPTPTPTPTPVSFDLSATTELTPGENYHAEWEASGGKYYFFTPTKETTGKYKIYSTDDDNNTDTYVELYELNVDGTLGARITSDDDSGENRQFSLEYMLELGKTYVYKVKAYADSSGICTVYFSAVRTIIESGTLESGGEWTLFEDGECLFTGRGDYLYYAGTNKDRIEKITVEGDFRYIDNPNPAFDVYFGYDSQEFGFVNPEIIWELHTKSLEVSAFYDCRNLRSIELSEGVEGIGKGAFADCVNLRNIELPKSLKQIREGAFYCCYKLQAIELPENLKEIDAHTFAFCGNLQSVELPEGLDCIYSYAFYRCGLKSINIPSNVTCIGYYSFMDLKECVFEGNRPAKMSDSAFPSGLTAYYHGNLSSWSKQKAGRDKNGITWVNMDNTSLKTPALVSATNVNNGVELKWKASQGASWYRVFRKNNSGNWTKVADTQDLSYVDSKVVSGKSYIYTVRCLNVHRTGYISGFDKTGKSALYLAPGVVTKIANINTGGIQITWNKIAGAKGYIVYRKDGKGSYKKVTTITNGSTVTYKDTTAKTNGQKYTFAIRAYSGNYKGLYVEKTYYRLGTHTISSVTNNAAGTITVKWNGNRNATGYQVRYKDGNQYITITISDQGTLNTVISELKKGKTYTVYVRGYKNVDGVNYYSAWSVAKAVKINR